jgi:hypothetical protein
LNPYQRKPDDIGNGLIVQHRQQISGYRQFLVLSTLFQTNLDPLFPTDFYPFLNPQFNGIRDGGVVCAMPYRRLSILSIDLK